MDVQEEGARAPDAVASVTIDHIRLLDSVIELTRQAKALAVHANEPPASLHLARAIVALKEGKSRLLAGKDIDVALMLLRMALALLDRADEGDAAIFVQQAIDILTDAPIAESDAVFDDDLLDALLPTHLPDQSS